ncbi:hypothetical protein RI367_004234 [Sorochytrium milnesiophthora]
MSSAINRRAAVAGAASLTLLLLGASTNDRVRSAVLPLRRAHMEAAPSGKLPIYDEEVPAEHIVEVLPTRLEIGIRQTRALASQAYRSTTSSLQSVVNSWIGIERRVGNTIDNLKSEDERLLPAGLYVFVAAFAGSILVRNRAIPLRVLTPPLFFAAASTYFLPHTTTNVYNFAFHSLPPEAQQRIRAAQDRSEETLAQVRGRVREIEDKALEIKSGVSKSAESMVSSVTDVLQTKTTATSQKPTTAQVVDKVEAMYTTRGKPGVREVIEEDREGKEHNV